MGEGFLKKLAEERGLHQVVVESAGTHAPEGSPPSSLAVQAAAELGVDIRMNRSSPLERRAVESADLILVMERGHRDFILAHWPDEGEGKVRMMWSFYQNPPAGDEVPDPIGLVMHVYRRIAQDLMECSEAVIKGISP